MRVNTREKNISQHRVPEPFRMPLFQSLDLYEITVEELQRYMASGWISSLHYVTYCLERIRLVRLPSARVEVLLSQESLSVSSIILVKSIPRSDHRNKP